MKKFFGILIISIFYSGTCFANLQRLHSEIEEAQIPIFGVSGSQGAIRIDFEQSATQQQRDQAQVIVNNFDWSETAQEDWEESKEPDLQSVKDQAVQAISNIDSYLAGADSANAAQVREEVKKIDERQKVIIKALLRIVQKTWRED